MRMSPCRRGSGVGIASVRSKEMFMAFRKSSVSSSPPGLLDRLRKRCVTVNLRFPTVFFGSEFKPGTGGKADQKILPWCPHSVCAWSVRECAHAERPAVPRRKRHGCHRGGEASGVDHGKQGHSEALVTHAQKSLNFAERGGKSSHLKEAITHLTEVKF